MDARRVLVGGVVADKPSRLVSPADPVVLRGEPPRFVSRGGGKLDAALERFAVPVAGRRALDAGASTGGFTDCLLQRGAAVVHAVDVGHGQLDARLRADPRVVLHERVNIRTATAVTLGGEGRPLAPVDLVTADLSFISLVAVAPVLAGPLLALDGDLVVLVKPQFEAGRAEVSRGKGVVRDPAVWRQVLGQVTSALEDAGTGIMGIMPSPISGQAGNVEFLVHAAAGRPSAGELAGGIDGAVGEAAVAAGRH